MCYVASDCVCVSGVGWGGGLLAVVVCFSCSVDYACVQAVVIVCVCVHVVVIVCVSCDGECVQVVVIVYM